MLFEQTAAKFRDEEINYGLIAAGHSPSVDEDIQLAMLQTMASAIKRGGEVPESDEIFVDEAHNNGGESCQRIFREHVRMNPNCILIGFTATPLGISHIYDKLIQAGKNSELRDCGSHVQHGAKYFAPDEPSEKLVGKVDTTGGEVAISAGKRMKYTQQVFGRVVEHYHRYNPERRPAVLFASGVEESKWFALHLERRGITAAHIDSDYCMIKGEIFPINQSRRDQIEKMVESGEINVICNRFVLREGIDWPFLYHGIFATVFGSLTAYIQAGGRLLRNHSSMDHVIIQDHGGNYWRHGSLNADRFWEITSNDRIEHARRSERCHDQKEKQPIVCPKCSMVRMGLRCQHCGDSWIGKTRAVLQVDGTLKELKNTQFKIRKMAKRTENLEKKWAYRVLAVKKSQKPTCEKMTFSQLYHAIARESYWSYPPKDLPLMPINETEWFLPIKEVPKERLIAYERD